jgi:hypothetical protein
MSYELIKTSEGLYGLKDINEKLFTYNGNTEFLLYFPKKNFIEEGFLLGYIENKIYKELYVLKNGTIQQEQNFHLDKRGNGIIPIHAISLFKKTNSYILIKDCKVIEQKKGEGYLFQIYERFLEGCMIVCDYSNSYRALDEKLNEITPKDENYNYLYDISGQKYHSSQHPVNKKFIFFYKRDELHNPIIFDIQKRIFFKCELPKQVVSILKIENNVVKVSYIDSNTGVYKRKNIKSQVVE